MNFEQLAGLIKAGFNEEQIRNIGSIMGTGGGTLPSAAQSTNTGTGTNTGTNTPAPTPTPTPTDPATPATPPATPPADPPTPADPSTPPASGESETVSLLKEMLGMMQKGNINTVGTGTIPEQTGADVLAEILNPTPKK